MQCDEACMWLNFPFPFNKFKIHHFRYFSCNSLLEMGGVSNFCVIFSIITMASARRIAQEDEYYYKLPPPSAPPLPPAPAALRPGITVIVGAIATIFAITFMLLLYVQHCKTGSLADSGVALPLARADSGVNRKVIQQLPLFRFASLRGQKDGLECAVCLTRFEPEEVLRLLPKCKHAFHVECVDTWLDQHSTCPLCRYRVRPEDVLLIDCHGSNHKALHNYRRSAGQITPSVGSAGQTTPRVGGGGYSNRHSSVGEKSGGVRVPGNELRRRSSFDSWSSRRRRSGQLSRNMSRRDERLGIVGDKHRLEHQILVQDGGEAAASELRQQQRGEVRAEKEEVLYIRTEMLMGGGDDDDDDDNHDDDDEEESSGSSSRGRRREIRAMRKTRGDVGERKGKEKEEEGMVKRLMDWIPQFQQQQKPDVASTSSSAPV